MMGTVPLTLTCKSITVTNKPREILVSVYLYAGFILARVVRVKNERYR